MKYVLNRENMVIAIHDAAQNLEGSYSGLRIYVTDELFELGTIVIPPPDYGTGFAAACADFRQACAAIGELTGQSDFKGGFDEFSAFRKSATAKTPEGLSLSLDWSAANESCVYEAKKLGIGQPEWWHKCWSE